MPDDSSTRPVATRSVSRWLLLDALRGLALVWMTVFHFCFDLSYLGLWRQDFYHDPFWTWQRVGIVTLFLLCVGMSQALVQARPGPASAVAPWQGARWWRVAACAALVTVASYLAFAQGYIYFGVLHCIAAVSLALWWMRRWRGPLLLALAALAMATPQAYRALASGLPPALVQALDGRAGSVLGLITRLPRTEDYVPLLPWLGVAMLGLWIGRQLAGRSWLPAAAGHGSGRNGSNGRNGLLRLLAALGRHSLPYYMLHQLVLMGGLLALRALLKP